MEIPNRKQGFSVKYGFKFRNLWILIPWNMDFNSVVCGLWEKTTNTTHTTNTTSDCLYNDNTWLCGYFEGNSHNNLPGRQVVINNSLCLSDDPQKRQYRQYNNANTSWHECHEVFVWISFQWLIFKERGKVRPIFYSKSSDISHRILKPRYSF